MPRRRLSAIFILFLLASTSLADPCPGSTSLVSGTAMQMTINGTQPLLFDISPGAADSSLSLFASWSNPASADAYASPWCSPNALSFSYANCSYSSSNLTLLLPINAPSSSWFFSLSFASSPTPPSSVYVTVTSFSACPNACSGHGVCGEGICLCTPPYDGMASDCSVFSLASSYTMQSILGPTGVVGAVPAPTLPINPGSSVYTVTFQYSLPPGSFLLVASGRIPMLVSYDASLNASLSSASFSPANPLLPVYISILPPPNSASSPSFTSPPFSISASTSWQCPNNCSGQGQCHAYGCACNVGFMSLPDCSLFDLNIQNNVSAAATIPANGWIYFHIGVTDATELEWDVIVNDPLCAPSINMYAMQGNRPNATTYTYQSYGINLERKLTISIGGPRQGLPSVWWLGLTSPLTCNVNVTGTSTRLCPNDCSENGLCQAGSCICVPPFTLDDCSATDVELYADTPVSVSVAADQLSFFHTQVLGDDALYIRAEELITQGSVILLVRLNGYPSASLFTYRNDSPSALHEILIPSTQATGVWYIALLGAASLSPPQSLAPVHLSVSEGCSAYSTCAECAPDPNCGWCSTDPLNSIHGTCVAGNSLEAYSATCEAYLFDTCSTDASRHHTTFFGLLLGVGLGSLLIIAVAAAAFVIYQHWHRSFKEALSARPDR